MKLDQFGVIWVSNLIDQRLVLWLHGAASKFPFEVV